MCCIFIFTFLPYFPLAFLCILTQTRAQIFVPVTVQMACLSGQTSPSVLHSQAGDGFGLAEVRKVKSGAGSIPSLRRVLCAYLLVGSAQEQLNEESRAVPPGP